MRELIQVIELVVIFKDRNNYPGFAFKADVQKDEITQLIDEYNKQEEPRILSVYSGVFSKEMESIEQDLLKSKEPYEAVERTDIDEFICLPSYQLGLLKFKS